MEKVLEHSRANVSIKDKETGVILFKDSNLFVDVGRALIRDVFIGAATASPLNTTFWVCDLGNDAGLPTVTQANLLNYINASVAVKGGYPIALSGEGTGAHFQFDYTASGGDKTIRELGLFYRTDVVTNDWPNPHDTTGAVGYMVARLITTRNSITVGSGKTITIDWKIIF
jgi:hypothetical protein